MDAIANPRRYTLNNPEDYLPTSLELVEKSDYLGALQVDAGSLLTPTFAESLVTWV